MDAVNLILVIVIILVICWLVMMFVDFNDIRLDSPSMDLMPPEVEGFHCATCSGKSRSECADCDNCVYCRTSDGRQGCVAGNRFGPTNPYHRRICTQWEHGGNSGRPGIPGRPRVPTYPWGWNRYFPWYRRPNYPRRPTYPRRRWWF